MKQLNIFLLLISISVPVMTNITMEETAYPIGGNIYIPCNTTGYRVGKIEWLKDNQPLQYDDKFVISENNTLTVVRANKTDGGTYKCHGADRLSSFKSSVVINIRVPANTHIRMEKTTFLVDGNISIPCDVEGYPVPKVVWFKDNNLLQNNKKFVVFENNTLTVVRASVYDEGIYRCEAENSFSSSKSSVGIKIEGMAEFTAYKKTKSVVYFRCIVTKGIDEGLVKFTGNYSAAESSLKVKFETPAVPCTLWANSYCFNISNLLNNKIYTFNVSVVLRSGTFGNPASVAVHTKEEAPGPPEDLRLVSYTPTSAEIQWHHPNQTNGVLRKFSITINEIDTFEQDKCCRDFHNIDQTVEKEKPLYGGQLEGLIPASTYAISVTFKTLYSGSPKVIDVYTPPPPMKILRMPASLTPIYWKPREVTPADLPQYHPLIRFYLLLLVAPNADHQLPSLSNSSIEIGSLKQLLDLEIERQYAILERKNADDDQALQETIKVSGQMVGQQYELAWVQVSQYEEAYGLDIIESEPI